MIKKAAIDMVEYDGARQLARERGEVIKNLNEPADPIQLQPTNDEDIPAYLY